MAGKKRILVACGTGIATSTMVVHKLSVSLDKKGKGKLVEISQCKVGELVSKAPGYDLIVCTTQVSGKVEIPVINGTPFLTGIGADKIVDDIIEKLGI